MISYRQVIDAYPHGGGAYAVSRDNFGPGVSKLAGAALIVDYTLTVAVSIAAGVGQLTSAFPSTTPYTVPICLGILVLITALNLRGLGEGARAFLIPTLVFIVGLLAIIAVGLIHPLGLDSPQSGTSLVATHSVQAVTVLLVLKAFSAGCSALTGVEAIANGVPLFREPRVLRAKRTELLLGLILGLMLLGLAELADKFHVQPRNNQTVLSQIMTDAVGRNWAYYTVSLTITLVLALAANTSFGGLPVLTSLLARDHYLPRLFGVRDSRLVFGNGVLALSVFAGLLLVAVDGSTNTLIPLFAIGVFIGFTLSQAGLVVHWRRTRGSGWTRRSMINGVGAVITATATVIFLITKFVEGAWVVVVVIPLLILLFNRIETYYTRAGKELAIGIHPAATRAEAHPGGGAGDQRVPPHPVRAVRGHLVGRRGHRRDGGLRCCIDRVARGRRRAGLAAVGPRRRAPGHPYRVCVDRASPSCDWWTSSARTSDRQLVVLIPVVVPDRIRQRLLHNQVDLLLANKLHDRPDVVVARVPFPIRKARAAAEKEAADREAADGKRE